MGVLVDYGDGRRTPALNCFLRPASPLDEPTQPTADEGPKFKVGDRVDCFKDGGLRFRGEVLGQDKRPNFSDMLMVRRDDGVIGVDDQGGWCTDPATLRHVPRCVQCGGELPVGRSRCNAHQLPETTPSSNPPEAEAKAVGAKPDPYKEHEREQRGAHFQSWLRGQNARHRAALEKHKADLDRSTREREAALDRNTRHWPTAVSTPSYEDP